MFFGVGFFREPNKDSLLGIQSEKSAVNDFERKKKEIEECEGVVFIQVTNLHDLWSV